MKYCSLLIVAMLLSQLRLSQAQIPEYRLTAENLTQEAGICNELKFDIFLTWTNPLAVPEFEYAAGQYHLNANIPAIANGGTLTYSIDSSQLPQVFRPRNPTVFENQLRLAGNQVQGAENGFMLPSNAPVLIVRMKLRTSEQSFSYMPLNLQWRNELPNPITKIHAYVGNLNTNVTNPAFHFMNVNNNPLSPLCPNSAVLIFPPNGSHLLTRFIEFRWTSPPMATKYVISVATDSLITNKIITDTVYADTSVTFLITSYNQWLYWQVITYYGGGESLEIPSAVSKFRINSIPIVSSPADGSVFGNNLIAFSWRGAVFAEMYKLEIALDDSFNSMVFSDSTIADTAKSVFVTGIAPRHFFRVSSTDSSGADLGASPVRSFSIERNLVPAYPAPDTLLNDSVVAFGWFGIQEALQYRILLARDSGFTNIFLESEVINDTHSVLRIASAAYPIYWKVKAIDSLGREFRESVPRRLQVFYGFTLLYPPDNGAFAAGTIQFIWSSQPLSSRYHLFVSYDSLFTNLFFSDSLITDTASYIRFTPGETTRFFWKVHALDQGGNIMKVTETYRFSVAKFRLLLTYPDDNFDVDTGFMMFTWESDPVAAEFSFNLAYDSLFQNTYFQYSFITQLREAPVSFQHAGYERLFWRVIASDSSGNVIASAPYRRLGVFTCDFLIPVNVEPMQEMLCIACRDSGTWSIVNLNGAQASIISGIHDDSLRVFTGPNYGSLSVSYELDGHTTTNYVFIGGVLPVTFSNLSASSAANRVFLKWSTLYEINNKGFQIERSFNGGNWQSIGFVEGGLNTSEVRSYSYTDKNINSGTYRYRLMQIDVNGNFSFHEFLEEINIGVPEKLFLHQNYPNPFNPRTTIEFELPENGRVVIKVFDISGREIALLENSEHERGYYAVEFDGSSLNSGIYFCVLRFRNETKVARMMIIK